MLSMNRIDPTPIQVVLNANVYRVVKCDIPDVPRLPIYTPL